MLKRRREQEKECMKSKKEKSAVKKGNDFERRVFLIFSKLLDEENLFISAKRSQIYHKKKYYSGHRKKSITFDISIESFSEGAKEYSMLIIIECKDYSKLVPINDVEEFKAKLDQIAGKNVKAIMITRNGFQSSVLEYAKSSGIALARLIDNERINWDVDRTNNDKTRINDKVL